MSNEYLYGAYGHLGETVAQSAIQSGTVPVYIGLAPVNLIRNYATAGIINAPVKVSNYIDAQKKVGYSPDWSNFTLCEAIEAHFNNAKGNIGPIYVVNVLDPTTHRKNAVTPVNLVFSNGQATISSDTIILDTLALEDKTEGTDYTVDYNFTKKLVVISSKNPANKITGSVSATYYEVTPSSIDQDDIIGGVTGAGVHTGLGVISLIYQEQYAVSNLILAPKWSEVPAVYNAMVAAATQINGHWDAFVIADIPIVDLSGTVVDTITNAKTWKTTNGYTSERSKVFWPQAKNNDNKIFHLSVMAAVEFLRADNSHDGIPMETCGNKTIPITKQYFGASSSNQGFDQLTAKELTKEGISTCIFWGGNWALWGDHTAAYAYGANTDPRSIFDVSMRMMFFITNDFQREWGQLIDTPFSRQMKDRIINREQEKLDGYVAVGALIGTPTVEFIETNNNVTDMMNGDFRWDIPVTPTPPLKSASVYVAYTSAGFNAYFAE
ncbi:MAG: phage tail sheath family protein [bacterium]|nr:phage tail sheath family protein [bacterium]